MFNTLSRKLIATTVFVAVGLAPTMAAPAYADTAPRPTAAAEEPVSKTVEVSASSVPETRSAVSTVLTTNDASRAWPSVDADLTPKLQSAVDAGGGVVESDVAAIGIGIKIKIRCTISWPPLRIRCTITIIIIIIIGSANESHHSITAVEPAKL